MKNICFCVLSGGASSRMGQDKALLKLGNTYLINYIRETINKFLKTHDLSQKVPIFLILHQTKQAEQYMNLLGDTPRGEIVVDEEIWKRFFPDQPTPPNGSILGLWTAMEFLKYKFDYIFVVPNDRPLITVDMISVLWDIFISQQPEKSILDIKTRIKEGISYIPIWNDKKWEPLFAIYHIQTMVQIFEKKIIKNLYSLQKTFQELITEPLIKDKDGLDLRVVIKSIPIESELIKKDKNFVNNLQDIDSIVDLRKVEEDLAKRNKVL